eukprot:Nitzschia sp. Nitz4//scaffold515_size4186//569//2278//NITZ4_009253-RA/size4186-exonerate_est2genome-gene-0.2-mRNA-1//-1//CDS//3329553791//1194//frame0
MNYDEEEESLRLAQALQEQYRLEFLEHQRNAAARASAPPADVTSQQQGYGNSGVDDDDSVLARELYQQELDRYNGRDNGRSNSSSSSVNIHNSYNNSDTRNYGSYVAVPPRGRVVDDCPPLGRPASAATTERLTASSGGSSYSEDSMYAAQQAERVAQELDDAELAARISMYEDARQQERLRRAMEAPPRTKKAICFSLVLPLFCIAAVVTTVLLFLLGVFDASNVPLLGDLLGDDWYDPFSGDTVYSGGSVDLDTSDAIAWANNGKGLTLEVLNAMDDSWQSHLETAIENWDNGDPVDSLTLSITSVSYDYDCAAVRGKLKVCNGDYGATQWRGLNELLLDQSSNEIVQSVAFMNEYYVTGSDKADQMQYTVCHEVGHGFGLPHWDENFYNADLGNCMDYTSNPGNNMWPDSSNFLYLAEVYGGINITSGEYYSTSSTASSHLPEGVRHREMSVQQHTSSLSRLLSEDRQFRKNNDASLSFVDVVSKVSQPPGSQIDNELPHQRRVLKANDWFEVHRVLQEEDENLIKLQFFRLA